ncbi:MAG: IS66 family transposase [Rhodocyclaceae bacterium]
MATITLTTEEYQALVAERESLNRRLKTVTVERDLLQEKLNAFLRKLFDAKSEARGTEQKDLFFNEAEALAPAGTPAAEESLPESGILPHTRKKRGRKPLDPALPREIVRHELPEAERVCAHDGAVLVEIGVEIAEQLDIIPQQVRVIQHQRVKYACPCCDESIRVRPAPARIIPKGLLTESALAWVVTSKYMDALPLYRQAALLSRFGGELSRSTLAASIVRLGEAVQPIINLLRDHLLDAGLIHADETIIQVLKEPGRAAQTKSYLWAQTSGSGPPIRLFGYAPGRGASHAEALFAGIRPGGALMSDGYEVYGGIAEANGLTHLGCWAHCRRYFVEAEAVLPKAARGPDQLATRFIAAIASCMPWSPRQRTNRPRNGSGCGRRGRGRSWQGSSRCCSSTCTPWFPAACWARRCTIYPRNGRSSSAMSRMALGPSTTICARTPSARSSSAAATGCSPIPWPAPMPAPTSTRSSKPARPTASIPMPTSLASSASSPPPNRPTTSRRCCPGA